MLMIIGEAWGAEEAVQGMPFVGPAGKFLNSALSQAGIKRSECYVTNVFNLRPMPSNDIKNLCGTKADAIPNWPSIHSGKYIHSKYADELTRLFKEIEAVKPTMILGLGNTPCWAIIKRTGISKIRGAPIHTKYGKFFPTYHPSGVLRDWTLYPIFMRDLTVAAGEAEFPGVRRPHREIWIEPTFDDILRFFDQYVRPAHEISVDIETTGKMITCVGIAPSADRAIVIPFVTAKRRPYWSTLEEEVKVWKLLKSILESGKRIVGQNFLYDAHHLWRSYGIKAVPTDDTMLAHHALFIEMEKGLGHIASLHTNETRWKIMRKSETIKRED